MFSDAPVITTLAVKDMAVAKKFYEETLGLKKKDVPMMKDEMGIIYECGKGTAILVYPSGSAGTNQATYAGFSVKDISEVQKELKSKGVEFEEYDIPGIKTVNGIAEYPGGGRSAWFKDPDGNILALDEGMATKE